jgi:photosystem II stability/assembly factor-like uncharacterized protein
VGDRGTIRHTTDGGKNWTKQESSTDLHLRSVFFLGPDKGFIVGEQGIFLFTDNRGKEWKKRSDLNDYLFVKESLFAVSLFKIIFIDDNKGWIAGDYGRILCTTDGGKTWSRQQTGTDALLLDIEFTDSLFGWAVGQSGTILHTSDGGKTWQTQISESTYLLNGVEFADRLEGWICTYGNILHTTDGGKNWEAQIKRKMWLYDICFVDRQNIWLPGDFGEILHLAGSGRKPAVEIPWQ